VTCRMTTLASMQTIAADTFIDVVAAVIFSPDYSHVLLSLRKPEQHQGDRWEFPGGKQEVGESIELALLRELHEELGIRVLDYDEIKSLEHTYADKAVRLHFWAVTRFAGQPTGREGQQLRWVSREQLRDLEFPAGNQPIVDWLQVDFPARPLT